MVRAAWGCVLVLSADRADSVPLARRAAPAAADAFGLQLVVAQASTAVLTVERRVVSSHCDAMGRHPPRPGNAPPQGCSKPPQLISGLLNKTNSAAFFWCPVAYQLESQMYGLEMREDFAIVIPTILTIEHKEPRGHIAYF